MIKHWRYLKYVIRHKYFVMVECFKAGLFWQGIVHDWVKFLPSEWFPYVEHFYGKNTIKRDKTGYYNPVGVSDSFDRAWLHHQKYSKHHWQYWILVQDEDPDKALEIPINYLVEMVCDWRGAGKAQGKSDTMAWYEKNKGKMILHPESKKYVEFLLRSDL